MATSGCRLNHFIFTAGMALASLGSAAVVLGRGMLTGREPLPSDLAAAHAMILAERAARLEAEMRARDAEAEVSGVRLEIERLKLLLARMRQPRSPPR